METAPGVPTPAAPSGRQWRFSAAGHSAVMVEVGGGRRAYHVAGDSMVDGYAEGEVCPAG